MADAASSLASLRPRSAPGTSVVAADAFDDATRCTRCGDAGTLASACDHCAALLCDACLPYDVHRCAARDAALARAAAAAAAAAAGGTGAPAFTVCSHPRCRERTPVPLRCSYCREAFCTEHRIEGDHECAPWRAEQARLLKEKEEAKRRRQGAAPPAKAAPAVSPKGLHRDDAAAFTVLTPPQYGAGNPHRVVVNRNHAVGRTTEWLAEQLGLQAPGAPRTRFALLRARDLYPLPPMMVPVKELLRRGELAAGDALLLVPHDWLRGDVRTHCAAEAAAAERACPHWSRAVGLAVAA